MPLPLDMPDDYLWLPGSGRSTVGDLGELAVRLGSPVTYDRRGAVYWFDRFDNGLAGKELSDGGGSSSYYIQTDDVMSGYYALRFSVANNATTQPSLLKRLAVPIVSAMGLECSFTFSSNLSYIDFQIKRYNAASIMTMLARYDVANNLISIRKLGGGFVTVTQASPLPIDLTRWHTLKIVGDFDTGKYVRLAFDRLEFDLSAYDLYNAGATTFEYLEQAILIQRVTGQNTVVIIDNVIITLGDY